jgi:hypothetical protein
MEVLVESKNFDEGEHVKAIMGGMLYEGYVTNTIDNWLYTTSGFFNLESPGVKVYRIKEM